jgi:hypothetical protein
VVGSGAGTVERVDGRLIWKLRTNSTPFLAGPERMDSIPGRGEEVGVGSGGQGGGCRG